MVLHAGNPSTLEAEAGGFQVRSQPALPSDTFSQKKMVVGLASGNNCSHQPVRWSSYFLLVKPEGSSDSSCEREGFRGHF
jgi:hypothetical protein